jgi:hypothetical protein
MVGEVLLLENGKTDHFSVWPTYTGQTCTETQHEMLEGGPHTRQTSGHVKMDWSYVN